ncbi:MAG: aminopeptidase P family protein [Rhodospirillales bacterium]|nr:MAG: aminopeptidase P family protein [Rhodospirillales bacterium]
MTRATELVTSESLTFSPLPSGVTQELAQLLSRACSDRSPEEVCELIAGVAAAPQGVDPDSWLSLLGASVDPVLREQLVDLLAAARARLQAPVATVEERAGRLTALRRELRRRRLAGFLVPRADEHQGEQVALCSERLRWLTGFTGSAGIAVVLLQHAALFIDGRYTEQAKDEVDGAVWSVHHAVEEPLTNWLMSHLPEKARLGFDPWLHTAGQVESLREACHKARARLVAQAANPLDAIWQDRPPPPIAPVVAHDPRFAGAPAADKRRQVAEALSAAREDASILAAPDCIAWLLNIRGGDVPYTPVALAFAIVHRDARVEVFLDPRKLSPALEAQLGPEVRLQPPEALGPALDQLGAAGRVVRLDPNGVAFWIAERLRRAGAVIARGESPCALRKALKSAEEVDGIRAAHRRDGAALTRFLAWLDRTGAGGEITEIAAADRLEALRRDLPRFRGLSFPTISAAGPHGAIVHYRATRETNARLLPGSLYLVDSGAQYLDGTTDVTRTIAIGAPSVDQRAQFTRVLKGHIAIATVQFPTGTTGSQIDALARTALWQAGLDYDHGTGHGVGNYLNVHEGPQRISKLPNRVPLEPGMVISNEPGYYRPGAYGIRIENLVVVQAMPRPEGAERDLLGFETLTLAPIDRALITPELLTPAEAAWLDRYHADVRAALTPLLTDKDAAWLADVTRPIMQG